MSEMQLLLIDSAEPRQTKPRPASFRLDDRTRELGRLGVAAARAALRDASHAVAA